MSKNPPESLTVPTLFKIPKPKFTSQTQSKLLSKCPLKKKGGGGGKGRKGKKGERKKLHKRKHWHKVNSLILMRRIEAKQVKWDQNPVASWGHDRLIWAPRAWIAASFQITNCSTLNFFSLGQAPFHACNCPQCYVPQSWHVQHSGAWIVT